MESNSQSQNLNTATAFSSFIVKPLAAFKDVELENGQYLVRKIEKGTGKESKGVIVPAAVAEEFIGALENDSILTAAVAWYQEQRATVVKAAIEAGKTSFVASDYDNAAVIAMLDAQEVSEGRVSKEKIAVWFDNNVVSPLAQAFKAKLGESASNEKVLEVVAMYKSAFQMLAKRELVLAPEKKRNLQKALALLPESQMKQYCEKKLAQEVKVETVEMLGL